MRLHCQARVVDLKLAIQWESTNKRKKQCEIKAAYNSNIVGVPTTFGNDCGLNQ